MAEARARYNTNVGFNLHAHDRVYPHDAVENTRQTNTFKSHINFQQPKEYPKALEHYKQNVRERQFKGNPVQPPAVRQSYQDSDIFGTKGRSEVVQRSALASASASIRERQSRTFARSDVLGNDQAADKVGDGMLHHPITTRQEKNW